ncbi:GTP-binding Era [Micractinium conductrix]|uniref:GTP-binding Era n=1 Tax=Micractinium conductrix TaxID=554055 RepID=A0A2P6VBS8_9CHLO|nr:GTP-binding Era [Micractinium conductrix]|eukprot:PSC71545.1 GTP-binding Era [Micractinium conductrix]
MHAFSSAVVAHRVQLRATPVPLPWPAHRGAAQRPQGRRLTPCLARDKSQKGDDEAEPEFVELSEEQLASAVAALAAAVAEPEQGRPVEIIEDFTNFSPDPPGHRAGFVAIIGRPNAGKSTLLNALLRQSLSIVTHKAQTTRHRILGILSEPGYQAVFLDTPGIVTTKRNKMEERMMAAVQQAVKDSDCLLAIVDASHEPEAALAMIQPGEDWRGPPMAVLLNKTDLLEAEELESLAAWYKEHCRAQAVLPLSALEGRGLEAVQDWLEAQLPEGPSMYPKDIVSELPERFFVSEIIRKHVFLQYMQEVPYNVAVEVTTFKERPGAKVLVEAEIVLEKDRQKGIIIGKGGSALKQLGTAARAEVEEFLGRPVYLSLSVKVREGWRADAAQLNRLGY